MDFGQGLGYCQCTSVIDIICGGWHEVELIPGVETFIHEEWRCTYCFGSLVVCGKLG
jgi:hypothetical protein